MNWHLRSTIGIAFLLVAPVVWEPLNAQRVSRSDSVLQGLVDPTTYADSLVLCSSTTAGMVLCNTARLNRAEEELRNVSRQLIQELHAWERRESGVSNPYAVQAFLLSHRRWRALRDSDCDFRYGWRRGTVYLVIMVGCAEDLTRARIRELQKYRRELRRESAWWARVENTKVRP